MSSKGDFSDTSEHVNNEVKQMCQLMSCKSLAISEFLMMYQLIQQRLK